jgi:predicted transcriptional regulator
MTLHLTPALEQRLAHLAESGGRTPDELAQEAIDQYLLNIDRLTADVEEAEDQADHQGWLTSEEVLQRIEQRFRKSA